MTVSRWSICPGMSATIAPLTAAFKPLPVEREKEEEEEEEEEEEVRSEEEGVREGRREERGRGKAIHCGLL